MAEVQDPRRTLIRLIYEGADISEDIAPYLLSFEYTDKASGEADDLQITLEDREGLWRDPWLPDKGDTISATIITENWTEPDTSKSLYCGAFEIDDVKVSEPPMQVSIKATAAPRSTGLRNDLKNRNWENYTLSGIAADIAGQAGLSLEYLPSRDPLYDTRNQVKQDDLGFLMKLCEDEAFALKATDEKVVIFDEIEYEGNEPVQTITRGDPRIINMEIGTQLAGTYKSATAKYNDIDLDETHFAVYTDGGVEESGQTLQINQRVKSQAEAENLAKNKLHEENKKETTGSFTLMGDLGLVGGVNVGIAGYGKFDGTYFLESAKHSYGGSGYTTRIDIREGGPSKKKKKGKKKNKAARPQLDSGFDVYQ